MMEEAVRTGCKPVQENKSKFLLLHSSSGHKGALQEVLKEPSVQAQLADTKYAKETKALDQFFQTLNDDPSKAFYGLKHVEKALELGAISTLLLSDNLFRYLQSMISSIPRFEIFELIYVLSKCKCVGLLMYNSVSGTLRWWQKFANLAQVSTYFLACIIVENVLILLSWKHYNCN